jgi:hypothetical protein
MGDHADTENPKGEKGREKYPDDCPTSGIKREH